MPVPATDLPPLGEAVRAARKSAGLTQSDLAARLGVNQSTVSHIEIRGHLSADLYARIMSICKVPLRDWAKPLAVAVVDAAGEAA